MVCPVARNRHGVSRRRSGRRSLHVCTRWRKTWNWTFCWLRDGSESSSFRKPWCSIRNHGNPRAHRGNGPDGFRDNCRFCAITLVKLCRRLLRGGLSAWFLLPLLLLRPKILFIGLRSLLLVISIWFPLSVLDCDRGTGDGCWLITSGGAAVVDNPRRYLFDLLSSPRYAAMWFYGFGIAIIRRDKRVWLRAGR